MSNSDALTPDPDTSRLDLRAKAYAQKVKRRRAEADTARSLRSAIAAVEAASTHFHELIDCGAEVEPLDRRMLDHARELLEDVLGGISEVGL